MFGRARRRLAPGELRVRRRRRLRRLVILALPLLVVLTFLMPMAYFLLTSDEANLGSPGALMYTPESVALLAAETGIPVEALSAYLSAAGAFGEVGWTILAGIGEEECNHGRSELPGCPYGTVNFCGARGPMQFLGNTWRNGTDPVPSGECPGQPGQSGERYFTGNPVGAPVAEGQEGQGYGTDGDGDGVADPWMWLDATHAAARMLQHHRVHDDPRAAVRAYNSKPSYIDAVMANAAEYRAVEVRLLAEGRLSASGMWVGGLACPGQPRGGADPITDTRNTVATRKMANAVIACFGRPYAVHCYAPRPGDLYEHPRGRACDFMASHGESAAGGDRAWGRAMAEWVAANAEALNVLYVIWWDRSWNPSDGNIPWEQWRDYGGCANPCRDPYTGHYNHVHVSVKLMPGDPGWAHCSHGGCSE